MIYIPMVGSQRGGSTHRGQMLGACQIPPLRHRGYSAPSSTTRAGSWEIKHIHIHIHCRCFTKNMYRAVAVYGDELLCVDPVAAEARVHALLALLGQRVVSAAHQRLPAPIRDEHEVT